MITFHFLIGDTEFTYPTPPPPAAKKKLLGKYTKWGERRLLGVLEIIYLLDARD